MLEFLTMHADNDAIIILKKDHDKVKTLFDQFKKADDLRLKKKIVAEAIMELKIHATIEEEIFYPTLREQKVDKDLLNEADEEHHVAKLLIAELEQMNGKEDHYDAKFTVLAENIRHHIREEEGDLFPKARGTNVDFIQLGEQLLARKTQLKKNGIPPCAEEKMIHMHRKGSGDSPAQAAKRTKPVNRIVKHPAAKAGVSTKKIAPKTQPKTMRKTKRG